MKNYTLNRIRSNIKLASRIKKQPTLFGLPINIILDNLSKSKL